MTSQKIKFTHWLTALLASALFICVLPGCGGPQVRLGFPLADGNTWNYRGRTTYINGGQEQAMPALDYQITCRKLIARPKAPYSLNLTEEGQTLSNFLLTNGAKGMVDPLSGRIWLPYFARSGHSWKFQLQGSWVKMILKSQTTRTVPAGTFPTYLVIFIGPNSVRGSFWLDPDVGVIALSWTSRTWGARSTTSLELSSFSFPGQSEDSEEGN